MLPLRANDVGMIKTILAVTLVLALFLADVALANVPFGSAAAAFGSVAAPPFSLATADSMTLVYPRDLPCLCSVNPPRISLARGEYESIQAVVMPNEKALQQVHARVLSVVGPDGAPASAEQLRVSVAPLGSVYVGKSSFYTLPAGANSPSNYQGWIPDPIRTDITHVDVAAGNKQPFWVEVYADAQAQPGTYRITLGFDAEGTQPQTLIIEAQVWPFQIPDRPRLATSMTTNFTILDKVYGFTNTAQRDQMRQKYIDFLETFKIEPDLIYRYVPPTVDELLAIKNKWGLRQFNVYYIYPLNLFDPSQPAAWQKTIDGILELIGKAMAEYEKAGLAELAYVYGFDESRTEYYPAAKAVMRQIKERFPNLRIMTTLIDPTLGVQSGLAGLVDIWTPGVEKIDHASRAVVQELGDRVYWYTHAGVRNPHPNWFNGYPPSDTRVLLGPLSFKMNVDGFLYYNITRWINQGVMADGIFSYWDARTWNDAYGDGSLFYPGAQGPLASQRIQNFRDGMEDYNLLTELQTRVENTQGLPDETLAKARRLLAADDVATDQRQYTKDALVYRQWRDKVAAMIIALDDVAQSHRDPLGETKPTSQGDKQGVSIDSALYNHQLSVYQKAWISYPRWHIIESGPFPVRVHIDPSIKVKSLSVQHEESVVYSGTELPPGPVATLNLPDGVHILTLRVVDQADHVWEDKMVVTLKTAEITYPKPGDKLRGKVNFAVLPNYAADDVEHVTINMTPISLGELQHEKSRVFYDGAVIPANIKLDTLTLADGPYAVEYAAQLKSGRVSQCNVRVMVANWEIWKDEFLPPLTSGWFGTVDQKRTIVESTGWDYDNSAADVFASDDNRRIWSGNGAGYLIWETPDLRDATIALYATGSELHGITMSASTDQEAWADLPYVVVSEERLSAGWTKYVLQTRVSTYSGYFRLTLSDEMKSDTAQLGEVEFRLALSNSTERSTP